MERRRFTRVEFAILATVSCDGHQFQGEVDNISLHGVFLKNLQEIDVGRKGKITIALSPADPKVEIRGDVVAVRSSQEGTGFEFTRMDVESFTHLRKVVSYGLSDGDAIMGEFASYVDQKLHEDV